MATTPNHSSINPENLDYLLLSPLPQRVVISSTWIDRFFTSPSNTTNLFQEPHILVSGSKLVKPAPQTKTCLQQNWPSYFWRKFLAENGLFWPNRQNISKMKYLRSRWRWVFWVYLVLETTLCLTGSTIWRIFDSFVMSVVRTLIWVSIIDFFEMRK